jgi:DNA invertase Pin-like site-specific DNA recombinase
MKIGYVRISTSDQNTERQENMLNDFGVEKIFLDKASGKTANRPELSKMMDFVRENDTVVVESISRFARSTRDFLELMERLSEKDVKFISKKEAIDTSTPSGKFIQHFSLREKPRCARPPFLAVHANGFCCRSGT